MEEFFAKSEGVVLDLSVIPSISYLQEAAIPLKIPDSLALLIRRYKEDDKHNEILFKLLTRWQYGRPSFEKVEKWCSIMNEDLKREKIQTFGMEDVDDRIYRFCLEVCGAKGFDLEFSPKKNLLGDIIGKILGASFKKKWLILMRSRSLLAQIRGKIHICEIASRAESTLGRFGNAKTNFFEQRLRIPINRTRNVRWLIGGIIGLAGCFIFPVGYIGWGLWVIDP